MTEEQENKQKEEKKNSFWNIRRVFFGIGFIVIIAILIMHKNDHPDFSFGKIILVGGAVGIISLLGIFYEEISKKYREMIKKEQEKEIPDALKMSEIEEIVKKIAENETNQDHIKNFGDVETIVIGDNTIIVFPNIEFLNKSAEGEPLVTFAINANFPEKRTLISKEIPYQMLWRRINKLSTKPQEEPTREFSEVFDPTTGRVQRYSKTAQKQKEKPKENKSEEGVM